jgi:putative transposase
MLEKPDYGLSSERRGLHLNNGPPHPPKEIHRYESSPRLLTALRADGKPAEACRKRGVSDATVYNWRKRYGGLELSDLRKLKPLEEENRRLKKNVPDKELHLDALQALLEKYDSAR